MKKLLFLLAACTAMACDKAPQPIDSVDPNLGSVHSRWFFYTPASEPFGLAKQGPSTNGSYTSPDGWEAVGYEDMHTSIEGFPCLHEFQIGGVMLMPTVGGLQTVPGRLEDPDEGFRSRFDKADEVARPGYYAVRLKDYDIRVELTSTTRVAFQRYTFPASDESNILFDIGNAIGESGPVVDAGVRVLDPQRIEGYAVYQPLYARKYQPGATISVYFYAEVSRPADGWRLYRRGEEPFEGDELHGTGAGAALRYTTRAQEQIEVRIGLSYTSIKNARANLQGEADGLDFDDVRKRTQAKWSKSLGRIRVEGGSEAARTKFYTGLYHALLGRGIASDINGAYPHNDGSIGQIPTDGKGRPLFCHYNTDAVWGAYWDLALLWELAYPDYYNDFIRSQLLVYEDTGWLGDGIACSKFVSGVGTNMMSVIMAGAYQNGIRDFDVEKAYRAALRNELDGEYRPAGAGKEDIPAFMRFGYVPFDDGSQPLCGTKGSAYGASHTLEYSFSAYAVAQWAKALGRDGDYEQLTRLSRGWERLFDPDLRMIRPRRADGAFLENFDPLESWRGFQEGNAVQYTYFVPGDPDELIRRIGSEAFSARLDSIFTVARAAVFGGGKVVNAFSGVQSPYNHGNQPCLHISWLFNYAHKPWLTQKWTRLICDEFYGTDAEHGYGYGQDEDQGQLGAWYVMAAMGLFDVQGGTSLRPTFQIGSPQFDRITIRNDHGERFTIETEGNGPQACYVQSATLNGKPLDNCWFFRDEMTDGGTLRLKMGPQPNEQWGAKQSPSYSK